MTFEKDILTQLKRIAIPLKDEKVCVLRSLM